MQTTEKDYDAQLQDLLAGMNNWQKSQYCRAKKKGINMPLDQVRMFATAKKAG